MFFYSATKRKMQSRYYDMTEMDLFSHIKNYSMKCDFADHRKKKRYKKSLPNKSNGFYKILWIFKQFLVEKKNEKLEKKDEIIHRKQIQIENMMQALLHARKKLFGPSSEVTRKDIEQMELFPETEQLAK